MLVAVIHLLLGLGIGLLLTDLLGQYHDPIGWAFVVLGVLGHMWLWKRGEF